MICLFIAFLTGLMCGFWPAAFWGLGWKRSSEFWRNNYFHPEDDS